MLKTSAERVQTSQTMLHWKLYEKWGFNKSEKWYIHKPEILQKNEGQFELDSPDFKGTG